MRPSSIFSSDGLRGVRLRIDPVFVAVLVLIALAELGLRVVVERHPTAEPWSRIAGTEKDGYYPPPHVFDEEMGYRYRSEHRGRFVRTDFDVEMRTNNFGFRGPDFSLEKADDVFRVALLGDSLVAANQVPIPATWPFLLQQELAPVGGRRVELLNFAVDGYTTWNQRQLLEHRVLAFRPDAVVLHTDAHWLFYPYELYRAVTKRGRVLACTDRKDLMRHVREENRAALSLRRLLLRSSDLARGLSLLWGKKPVEEAAMRFFTSPRAEVHDVDRMLREMRDLSEDHGARFGLFFRGRPPAPKADPCRSLGLACALEIRVLRSYRGLQWEHDAHFDLDGNEVYATRVAPLFLELLAQLAKRPGDDSDSRPARP